MSTKDIKTDAEAPIKRRRPVLEGRFAEVAAAFNTWRVVPEENTPFKDVLDRGYWVNNARRMRPFDRIVVDADDGSYTAILLVRSVDKLGADVVPLFHADLGPIDTRLTSSKFTVAFKGPVNKWCVVQVDDPSKIVSKGHDARETAIGWLANNSKSLAA